MLGSVGQWVRDVGLGKISPWAGAGGYGQGEPGCGAVHRTERMGREAMGQCWGTRGSWCQAGLWGSGSGYG